MFFDWIAREGGAVLGWWLLTLLAGAAVYPLFYRLTSALPSRGYPLARAAGLMLIGFVYWLLNIFQLLRNTPGSTVLAGVMVLGVGLVSYATWPQRQQIPIVPWLRRNGSLVLTTEALFAILFVAWVIVRALNPSLVATEKPMEMAFLSGVRRSATFPPNDPWMSGYAISYYHFGYILMGTLANLSGVTNGTAFNLALPLLFALTGTGAFGIAYDLVAARVRNNPIPQPPRRFAERGSENQDSEAGGEVSPVHRGALGAGILAAVFAVVMGNLGTVLVEIPYQTCTAPAAYLQWMAIEDRDAYPPGDGSTCATANSASPEHWNFWWWFRYSRVVRDYDLGGKPIGAQPITEFPQFSFVLSDMHPHVLALPFAMLSIGLALNLVLGGRRLDPWEVLLYAIFVGGMVFLNSWDGVYLVLLVGAEALRRLIHNGTGRFASGDWRGIAGFGLALLALTAILYLPFFLSFRSQVQGVVVNILWPTQFQQFFVMFGPFIVILGAYLVAEAWRAGPRFNAPFARQVIGIGVGFLVVAFLVLTIWAWIRPDTRQAALQVVDQSGGLLGVLPLVLARRVQGLLTEGLLILALFVVVARLFARPAPDDDEQDAISYGPSTAFTLLLIAAGAVLTLVPDFAYLQDGFGVRINTIFKLYYQGWLLWSVASAFAVWSILAEGVPKLKRKRASARAVEPLDERFVPAQARRLFAISAVILVGMGLVYPVYAIYSRAIKEGDQSPGKVMTLDGGESLAASPDDYKVIQCLANVARSDKDVVAEATQPNIAYNVTGIYGRVSGLTGIPTLLGWDNHERQWRGSAFDTLNVYYENGQRVETRQEAIARLYNTVLWPEAQAVIKRYGITYVYVGPTERRDFDPSGIAKFDGLTPVCSSGNVAVYSAAAIEGQAPTTAGG